MWLHCFVLFWEKAQTQVLQKPLLPNTKLQWLPPLPILHWSWGALFGVGSNFPKSREHI